MMTTDFFFESSHRLDLIGVVDDWESAKIAHSREYSYDVRAVEHNSSRAKSESAVFFSFIIRRKDVHTCTENFSKTLAGRRVSYRYFDFRLSSVFGFFHDRQGSIRQCSQSMILVLCMGRLSESKSPFLLKHGRAVKPVVVDNPVAR